MRRPHAAATANGDGEESGGKGIGKAAEEGNPPTAAEEEAGKGDGGGEEEVTTLSPSLAAPKWPRRRQLAGRRVSKIQSSIDWNRRLGRSNAALSSLGPSSSSGTISSSAEVDGAAASADAAVVGWDGAAEDRRWPRLPRACDDEEAMPSSNLSEARLAPPPRGGVETAEAAVLLLPLLALMARDPMPPVMPSLPVQGKGRPSSSFAPFIPSGGGGSERGMDRRRG